MKEKNLTYREALIEANYFISGLRRWQTTRADREISLTYHSIFA
jgi:hypothetical protein